MCASQRSSNLSIGIAESLGLAKFYLQTSPSLPRERDIDTRKSYRTSEASLGVTMRLSYLDVRRDNYVARKSGDTYSNGRRFTNVETKWRSGKAHRTRDQRRRRVARGSILFRETTKNARRRDRANICRDTMINSGIKLTGCVGAESGDAPRHGFWPRSKARPRFFPTKNLSPYSLSSTRKKKTPQHRPNDPVRRLINSGFYWFSVFFSYSPMLAQSKYHKRKIFLRKNYASGSSGPQRALSERRGFFLHNGRAATR